MARTTTGNRKEQIIEVTRDLIFNRGFSNFTIRTVANEVGVSEAAIYKHFSSKEELLLALLDYLFAPWQKAMRKIAEEKRTAVGRLKSVALTHIVFLTEKKLNPMLFFSEARNPESGKLLEVLQSNILFLSTLSASLFREGTSAGEFPEKLKIDAATACFIGTIQSSVIKWTIFQTETDLKKVTSKNVTFFLNSIKSQGTQS